MFTKDGKTLTQGTTGNKVPFVNITHEVPVIGAILRLGRRSDELFDSGVFVKEIGMLEKAYVDLWVGSVSSVRVFEVVGHVYALDVSPASSGAFFML